MGASPNLSLVPNRPQRLGIFTGKPGTEVFRRLPARKLQLEWNFRPMTSNANPDDRRDRDALLESVADGDHTVIGRLTEQFLPEIEAYLKKEMGAVVAAKDTSEDLAQSVCREALQGLADGRVAYQGEPQFRQWLYQAAKHKVLNRSRRWQTERRDARREVAHGPEAESAMHADASHATPSMEVSRKEASQQVQLLLAQLPDRDQEVVRLAHLEGMDHAAIADKLELTPNHTRVILSRALARIATLASNPSTRAEDRD